jgi:hypothetical protein
MRIVPNRLMCIKAYAKVTKEAHNRSDHSGLVRGKKAPEVIAEHKDWIVRRWLQRVNSEPELIGVILSDAERQDHVPDLLDEIIAHACEYPIQIEERQKAAERHGTLRYHQGYSVPMLIKESQLLQNMIAECVQGHFDEINKSTLVPDLTKMFDRNAHELKESTRTYIRQLDWHTSRGGDRR